MTLDANMYRLNIPTIKALTIEKTPKERLELLGSLAVSTGVPIIILAYYMMEIYGLSPEWENVAERLKKFYCIKQVLNVRQLSQA